MLNVTWLRIKKFKFYKMHRIKDSLCPCCQSVCAFFMRKLCWKTDNTRGKTCDFQLWAVMDTPTQSLLKPLGCWLLVGQPGTFSCTWPNSHWLFIQSQCYLQTCQDALNQKSHTRTEFSFGVFFDLWQFFEQLNDCNWKRKLIRKILMHFIFMLSPMGFLLQYLTWPPKLCCYIAILRSNCFNTSIIFTYQLLSSCVIKSVCTKLSLHQ